VSLLRLLEKISNGSVIEISLTGTAILLKPGVLTGGPVVHDCPFSRSIGYFLEPIVALAPFSKRPLMLTLRGITTDERDLSVDLIRTVTLPHLAMFGIDDGLELKVRSPLDSKFLALRIWLSAKPFDRSKREGPLREAVEKYSLYHRSSSR